MNEISDLVKETLESSLFFLLCEDTVRSWPLNQEASPWQAPDQAASVLILPPNPPPPRLVRNKYMLFKPPPTQVCGIFVIAA